MSRTENTRRIGLVVVLGCMIAACSNPLKQAEELAQQGRELAYAGQLDVAQAKFEEAKLTLEPGSDHYLEDQLYLDHARYSSNQALIELLRDQPQNARTAFIGLLDDLGSDVDAHHDLEIDNAQTRSNVAMGAAIALSIAGGLATGLTAPDAASADQMLSIVNQSTQALLDYSIATLDDFEVEAQTPGVIEADYLRMPLFAHIHELSAIGRLRSSSGGWCTASLIGNRLALTNAHCVHDGVDRLESFQLTLEFDKLGEWRKSQKSEIGDWSGGDVGVSAIHVSDLYTPTAGSSASDAQCGNDWALLELDSHPAGIGYFELNPELAVRRGSDPLVYEKSTNARVGESLVIAGYSGDLNQGSLITMDYGCPVIPSFGATLRYRCATFQGASGSPILLADGPYRLTHVVGVNACGSKDRQHDSWRSYTSRSNLVGTASGTVVDRFVDKAMELRQKTGSIYNPSLFGEDKTALTN